MTKSRLGRETRQISVIFGYHVTNFDAFDYCRRRQIAGLTHDTPFPSKDEEMDLELYGRAIVKDLCQRLSLSSRPITVEVGLIPRPGRTSDIDVETEDEDEDEDIPQAGHPTIAKCGHYNYELVIAFTKVITWDGCRATEDMRNEAAAKIPKQLIEDVKKLLMRQDNPVWWKGGSDPRD
ncbi:hypothetical protein C8Q73DRAFT_668816 [Cubamyces lactineus]|nr:hypothetical protein C8Q73DRAFT_668816 [Cubamyces lactineus]